jgi:hypothetical protein
MPRERRFSPAQTELEPEKDGSAPAQTELEPEIPAERRLRRRPPAPRPEPNEREVFPALVHPEAAYGAGTSGASAARCAPSSSRGTDANCPASEQPATLTRNVRSTASSTSPHGNHGL